MVVLKLEKQRSRA